jgi:two-component system, OmpR family, sensor kinase
VSTGSLRRRVTLAVLGLLLAAVVTFGVIVTLAYQQRREDDQHRRLAAAAETLQEVWGSDGIKGTLTALHLEGIDVKVRQNGEVVVDPAAVADEKPGARTVKQLDPASLLTVHVTLRDGATATLMASPDAIHGDVKNLVVLETLVGAALLLVGALVVTWVTRRALRPLDHVAEVAEGIAAGDLDRRLRPNRSNTELGRMAAAFDRMVDALQEALERSRAAEATTRQFLADASHELRTPIASLQATAETLLREQPGRPERDELEARLAGQAARLGRLVSDLLDLARLDADRARAGAEIDLQSVAWAALDQSSTAVGRVRVAIDPAGPPPPVRGDAQALARVVRNLLDNAPGESCIEVVLEGSATEARVRVVDDGPGVPAAERERIFERFVRLDGAGRPGAGLGLAIARAIARQHGGDLRCDSVERGASFTLLLPAAR